MKMAIVRRGNPEGVGVVRVGVRKGLKNLKKWLRLVVEGFAIYFW